MKGNFSLTPLPGVIEKLQICLRRLKDNRIVKDDTIRLDFIRSEDGLFRGCLDRTDKMLVFSLPFIEALMALVVAINDTRFPRDKNPADERPKIKPA